MTPDDDDAGCVAGCVVLVIVAVILALLAVGAVALWVLGGRLVG